MIEKLHIGAKVIFVPFIEDTRSRTIKEIKDARKKASSSVIYINEPHKYFTIEFVWNGYKMRESFKFCDVGEVVEIVG